ncbi:MAG TPA: aromatic ring-hydroxylating dioxygenase subunit alpha [Acidimicrobiales bacterium]|nr:aromatic ring-hydroxylating dioxygenase subunit alpha [Acidimicrobiales bacterium]
MLSEEENERLTRVGRGTPMGELLRRYWHPIAAESEFEGRSIKPVRIMGEDLVLYRDERGTYGLVDRHCPHRRADLAHAIVEECGIRCSYHGWKFDETGRCVHQPFEDTVQPNSRFKDQVSVNAYRVKAKAGLCWAYLGPEPAPLIPTWEPFTYENGFCQIAFSDVPCNWLQCQENSIDPVHFEWLHNNWSMVLSGQREPYAPTHRQISFEEFEYGFGYHRLLEDEDESDFNWLLQRLCILPNLFLPRTHFEWRVPVDDETTLSVVWSYTRVPRDCEPYRQATIPHWYAPITDPVSGRWITSHVINQDTVAWVGQGTVAQRNLEHLGRSDRGVIMLRRQLELDMQAVAEGRDPKGIIRDEGANVCIDLPGNRRELFLVGLERAEWLRQFAVTSKNNPGDYFSLLVGQPPEVRAAFEEAVRI